MKTRKEQILWTLYACVLVCLFLLSSTDLIIKERKVEVVSLSAIMEGNGEGYSANFRKGMDRAAIELNADVSFLSPYEENNQHQQLAMMVREQQDGARALIVTPTKEMSVGDMLVQQNITVPLILVNASAEFEKASAVVTADYTAMGQTLAKEIIRKHSQEYSIWLYSNLQESEATWQFGEAIRESLTAAGYELDSLYRRDESTLTDAIKSLKSLNSESAIIIALDQESLTEAAAVLSDMGGVADKIAGLYGRGTTIQILNYLDRDVISGICAIDDFSAGYISVKRAVEAVTNELTEKKTVMQSYYIEKADLRKSQYEKMLYPIE